MNAKTHILLIAMSLFVFSLRAQEYIPGKNTCFSPHYSVVIIGMYTIGDKGLYYYKEGNESQSPYLSYLKDYKHVYGTEHFFGYNNKTHKFYYYTDNAIACYMPQEKNCIEKFTKEIMQSGVKKMNENEIKSIISSIRTKMEDDFRQKNDSIIIANKRKEEQRKIDSLEAVKQNKEAQESYRQTHDWHQLNLKSSTIFRCDFCSETHLEKNIYVSALSSDTIYYYKKEPDQSLLGQSFHQLHYAKMASGFKNTQSFKEYVAIWRDSIENNNQFSNKEALRINQQSYIDFVSTIQKMAPVGFIQNWGWHLNTVSGIESYFSFFNTSKKTIKYVEFFFQMYNDVGDRCFLRYNDSYTGSVKGVGPVPSFTASSWSWDRATHYTTGDATSMKIVKVIVTYMDGSSKVLTGNMIKYEN